MKKVFSMIAFALIAMSANAQVFCHADGTVIENGSTLTMSDVVYDEEEVGADIKLTDLYVLNNTEASLDVSINVLNSAMTLGQFQCCFGGNCRIIKAGKSASLTATLAAGEKQEINNTEWSTTKGKYGSCTVVFTTGDQKVTVNFVYEKSAGIDTVDSEQVTGNKSGMFNVAGQKVAPNYNGVVISNGKKVIK